MNIAIDLQPLYSGHRSRGIGKYVSCLIQSILDKDKENNYFLLNFYGNIDISEKLTFSKNAVELNLYEMTKEHLHFYATKEDLVFFRKFIKEIILNYNIDLYHITAAVDDFEIYRKDYFTDCKLISTVYDLIPLIFSDFYLKDIKYINKYCECLTQFIFADHVLSDSKSAKYDLIKYLGAKENRITAIMSGVDTKIKKIKTDPSKCLELFKKYKIDSKYLLFVGADDFRKNLIKTVSAFCKINQNLLKEYQLVIVCQIRKEISHQLKELAKENKCYNRVIVTGYVSDDEMLTLLNNAYWALFPSLYEGFGLPIIEAWTCSVPVITSNNSSLIEIAEGAAIIVDPTDTKSITEGINEALTTNNRNNYIEKGIDNLKKYTWENVAYKTINTYKLTYDYKKNAILEKEYLTCVKHIRKECSKSIKIIDKIKSIKKYL